MKNLLLENASVKIAALLLAILLWFFVSAKGQTEIAMSVPIVYNSIPAGLEILNHNVQSAAVVLRGHEHLLKSVRHGELRVSLDLGKAKEGESELLLKKDDIAVPATVTVTKIEPSAIRVVLEKTAAKSVPVRPALVGSPPAGFWVQRVESTPKEILVEGPRTEVAKVSYLKTEAVDITGVTGNIRQEAELVLSGKQVRPKAEKVMVVITIAGRSR